MKKLKIDFNAPVILGFTGISLVVLILYSLIGDGVLRTLGIHYTSWGDFRMYLRMFAHIFAHAGLAHFTGNFMLILAVGPMVEEKYGSSRLAMMMAVTAVVTGLINVIFFRQINLVGASGVVFMLILLASFVNIREGKFPLTVLLVAVLFIGNEIVTGVLRTDTISQMGHIIGGLCGGGFGFAIYGDKMARKKP